MLGEASAFVGRQRAIWVYLTFESLEERFARWSCSCAPVIRATPRDLCCDAAVDVLGYGRSPPLGYGSWPGLTSRLVVRVRAFTCRRARGRRDETSGETRVHGDDSPVVCARQCPRLTW